MKTRFLSFLTILVVLLAWAALVFIHRTTQEAALQDAQEGLQQKAALLAHAVSEFLSLRLDYNQEALEEIYLKEILSAFLQPLEGNGGMSIWILREGKLYQTNDPVFLLSLRSFETDQVLEFIQNQQIGSLMTNSELHKNQFLHAWSPVAVGGYEWMLGVSMPVDKVLKNSAWQTTYEKMIWGLFGVSLVVLALLMWANSS